ncbi:MAG: hypothetical protein JOY71_05795, partial [Acetobacteraceae bacterium]|nr:hypothetical protein [Acetobacteraceae bacterium]
FISEALAALNASGSLRLTHHPGSWGSTTQDAARLAHLTRVLTEVMGPIAPRLVDRARKQAGSAEHMEALCAELIPGDTARARFRRLLAEGVINT